MSARANQLLEAGLWLKMSGDLDGARRLFEQALKIDPDSIRARELLGQAVPESEAVPEELRDVPITRTDLFAVPLPRLFQDEAPAPASIPEEWWNAPPSMGNTARFFVRPPDAPASPEAPGPTRTIPWGPSPLSPRPSAVASFDPGRTAVVPPPAEFEGEDLGESGDDFGLELSEGTPAPPSRTTGAIPLPPIPGAPSPVPAPAPSGLGPAATPAPASSWTTGAIPLPPAATPAPGPFAGASARMSRTPAPASPPAAEARPAEPSRSTGPVPLPPAAAVRGTAAPGHSAAGPSWAAAIPAAATPSPAAGHGVVPLPLARELSGSAPARPGPFREPVPWQMPGGPAPATPSRGVSPPPLPGGPPVLSPPRAPPAAPPPLPAASPPVAARDAWGGEGDGPTLLAPEGPAEALELLAKPHSVSGFTPLPAPRDPRAEAVRLFERSRELEKLDDHSGARELLLQAQALYPELSGLEEALERSEAKLQTIYESKIGKLSAVPRVRLKEDEVIWLNLDHRAGFMLAQIDGTLTFEDLFSVSGMSRLDTARILAQLLDQRVIVS